MSFKKIPYNLLIALSAIILFVPFLGKVHLFDWDEINFAECAREMIVSGNYFSVQINFQPFWEKPPLFIWMQMLSMRLFGINEFAARFPNAVCGILTLLVLFNIGKRLYDYRFGLLWVLSYVGSFLPHFYFKSGIIDPWFNLFIFCGLYFFIVFESNKKYITLVFSALLIGFAVLTKGPVAVLIFGLCIVVYFATNGFKSIINLKQIIVFSAACASIGGVWFLILIATGNEHIIKEFFLYQIRLFNTQDSGHGGSFFYHWIILLVGCFPSSVFALQGFNVNKFSTLTQNRFNKWMLILFWVVLILFSIVKTKIVHYSSLCYFPITYLSATVLYKLMLGEIKLKKITYVLLLILGGIISIAFALLPIIDKYKSVIINSNIIHDKFAVENLKANVYWSGYEWLIGVSLFVGIMLVLLFFRSSKKFIWLPSVFVVCMIIINLSLVIIVPKIEKYSQGAAIEFYESNKGKDCYITPLGFFSYAHYFYSQKAQPTNSNSYNKDWLLSGDIDKPVYFVSKITSVEEIKNSYPQLKELYRKNGFVFFVRK